MKIYSGKSDLMSGVRTKHIYSDNHNLRQISHINGNKVGSVNYKMHFTTCEKEDVVNTLRPENLTLEVYNVKEPYNVYHTGELTLKYNTTTAYNEHEATFLESSRTYTFRVIPESYFRGLMLVEKELDFNTNKFGIYTQIEIDVMRDDGKFFHGTLLKDSRNLADNNSKFLVFNIPIETSILYFYDVSSLSWRSTETYFGTDDYFKYSKIRFDENGTFDWDTSLRYSLDPYGFSEIKLLEIIDKSLYDIYVFFSDPIQNSDFWFNNITFDNNFNFVTNIKSVLYYGLGKRAIQSIIGVRLQVDTISNAESNDLNTITEEINVIQRVEIFPSDSLNTGISINTQYQDFEIKLYIPFKTNQSIVKQYLDDNCELQKYRFFYLDFAEMIVKISKEYIDRIEYLGTNNYSILETVFTNSKEIN